MTPESLAVLYFRLYRLCVFLQSHSFSLSPPVQKRGVSFCLSMIFWKQAKTLKESLFIGYLCLHFCVFK